MPQWVLRTKGTLRGFLLSILRAPRQMTPASIRCSAVWPMPIPYPEVFAGPTFNANGGWHLKRVVSAQVVVLNWLALGKPAAAPGQLFLGARLSAKQCSAVKYLEHLCVDGNSPTEVDAAFMGRAASKMENMEQVLSAVARSVEVLKVGEKKYFNSSLSRPECADGQIAQKLGEQVGRLTKQENVVAKPLIADRLVFPGPPRFDPGEYLDVETSQLYDRPLDLGVKAEEYRGDVPRV